MNRNEVMSNNIDSIINKTAINNFCNKYGIIELSVFGSILRDDFNLESDIDFLVTFREKSEHTLFDIARMKDELQDILGRQVDFVGRKAVGKSNNIFRKTSILESVQIIYAA